jgi:predicted RND superfamily exporter protein
LAVKLDEIEMPVVSNRAQFDANSGWLLERLVFNYRGAVLMLCLAITLVLGWFAAQLPVNANFERMIPTSHPYVKNYLENQVALRTLGNSVRIAVENPNGDIFDKDFQMAVRDINDAIYLMPGVDRGYQRSLWTPNVRWTEVTEDGYRGGPVMPDNYDGSPLKNNELKTNIQRAGVVGTYVASDFRSTIIVAPLMERSQETGKPLDYGQFSRDLESKVRSLEADGKVRVHIIGFAKVVGDLIAGLEQVMGYFLIAAATAALCVFWSTRDIRSTLMLVITAMVGVVWMLGVMSLLGYELDPYSLLGPFLIFAIGISHGAQKMNGIMQDVGRGTDKYVAARYTFRRLFMAGLTALLTNIVGFAVLMVIDIPVIHDLAITTSIGVFILIFTKLLLIPVLLSYVGVGEAAARRSLRDSGSERGLWSALERFTTRGGAIFAVSAMVVVTVVSVWISMGLQIGDLDPGAPELRADSRYNLDVDYVNSHYGLSGDVFATILKTNRGECDKYPALMEADRLAEVLRNHENVKAVRTVSDQVRMFNAGSFEGNVKFATIPINPSASFRAVQTVRTELTELANSNCDVLPILAYLTDHKAATLESVEKVVSEFARENSVPERQFLLLAGSAGIEQATNMVVRDGIIKMYLAVYGSVALLCMVTFRSWRATVIALVPLIITSLLCKALMVWLGIGLKVATLPVIALGVGVGVDYALYLLSIQIGLQRKGMSLRAAYRQALMFTGKVVALVGVTMAAGVVTWAWSPIKFQADMGILLTFMFLWNMVGALTLIPALSYFLLDTPAKAGAKGVTPAISHEITPLNS